MLKKQNNKHSRTIHFVSISRNNTEKTRPQIESCSRLAIQPSLASNLRDDRNELYNRFVARISFFTVAPCRDRLPFVHSFVINVRVYPCVRSVTSITLLERDAPVRRAPEMHVSLREIPQDSQ